MYISRKVILKISKNVKCMNIAELMRELNNIREELNDTMHPVSWARAKDLMEYRDELRAELAERNEG